MTEKIPVAFQKLSQKGIPLCPSTPGSAWLHWPIKFKGGGVHPAVASSEVSRGPWEAAERVRPCSATAALRQHETLLRRPQQLHCSVSGPPARSGCSPHIQPVCAAWGLPATGTNTALKPPIYSQPRRGTLLMNIFLMNMQIWVFARLKKSSGHPSSI